MKYFVLPALIASLLLIMPPVARAAASTGQMNLIRNAAAAFEQMPAMVPRCVLNNARGIVVVPNALKSRLLFGGGQQLGVLVTRLPDKSWSAPSFVTFSGAKVVDELYGVGVRNVILILNTPRAVADAEAGTLYPGAGIPITAGPIGADRCDSCTVPAVYSYVSSACTIFRATVKASLLAIDHCANWSVYGMANPLRMPGMKALGAARNFDCTVARATGAPVKVCGWAHRGRTLGEGA
ncbi:MAG: YSC84-related protein [Syntrophobacteraceae bacterium]|nr:YSC84-related protein [Syntrophobacteraceae bacterium]